MKLRPTGNALRIWTPGCASGEETYSVAISLLEFLGDKASRMPVQIFGTDLSESSVTKARDGIYPENIQSNVSPERLERFFTRVDGGYRISRDIRDMCIFAQHNILNDPPFSQMDLICCRNLLIYLEPVLQSKIISLFHYAAGPHGFLILGASEGVGSGNLFSVVDRGHKIFSKKATASRQAVTFALNRQSDRSDYSVTHAPPGRAEFGSHFVNLQQEFDRRLVTQYVPATVFVNDELEIVHTRGNVSRYLKLPSGRASFSVLKMARESLLIELRNALSRAKKENAAVHKENVLSRSENKNGNGDIHASEHKRGKSAVRLISFDVIPMRLGPLKELYFMIVFQEEPRVSSSRKERDRRQALTEADASNSRIIKLEQELSSTKEYLQSVIESQEATNEELQSANEEILSSNEELQSTNEELETAKEELQSTNEELTTVNDELRGRNADVSTVNSDLNNLLSSIDLAVVMLGPDGTIRRFTPMAQKSLGLIAADVGRPFLNIDRPVAIPNLQQLVLQVIGNAQTIEREVSVGNGHSYQLRILPYRTADGKHEGAVITLADFTRRRPEKAAH